MRAHSVKNHLERERTRPAMVQVDVDPTHNYSTQKLNSGLLAMDKIKMMLAQVHTELVKKTPSAQTTVQVWSLRL